MIGWLERYSGVAAWLQAVGVISALVFASIQLTQMNEVISRSAENNEISLRNDTRDLLTQINLAALDHPEAAGDYTGAQRLHLLRLQYFFRVHNLRMDGRFPEDEFEAETQYLIWTAGLEGFRGVWRDFRSQYPRSFQDWVDRAVSTDGPLEASDETISTEETSNESPTAPTSITPPGGLE